MENESVFKIYFAPLQESTDHIYRSAHAKYFGSVDKYFAPYIVRQHDGTLKSSHIRDIRPENNKDYPLVPQILAGNSTDFIFLTTVLQDFGYREVNWNLGCPYPMVTNKGLGSGLLPFPERIRSILDESLPVINCAVSVKMRTGLQSADDLYKIIEVLNDFPLKEVILHPRYGKQLYKGVPDEEVFAEAFRVIKHPLVYNGDIGSVPVFNRLQGQMCGISTWMIGRGMLKNPFFASLLKNGFATDRVERAEILGNFHAEIFNQYAKLLSGSSHLLMRMEKFWSYFCYSFPDPHKTFKCIKKSTSIIKYEAAVHSNFQRLRNHEEDERSPLA